MLTFLSLPQLSSQGLNVRTGQLAQRQAIPAPLEEKAKEAPEAPSALDRVRTQAPNAITLAGYALGLWWSVGGPTWAAVASILADELDGRLARAMNVTSELGSNLDWAADVALVPMTLLRFGHATNLGAVPLLLAPPILYGQARVRSDGWRPPLGSPRAAIMVATILFEALGGLRRTKV